MTIGEYGVPNKVPFDRVTHAPNANNKHRHDRTVYHAKERTNVKTTRKNLAKPTQHEVSTTGEYVVDKIVRKIGQGPHVKYIESQHRYGPTEGVVEFADRDPQPFFSK